MLLVVIRVMRLFMRLFMMVPPTTREQTGSREQGNSQFDQLHDDSSIVFLILGRILSPSERIL
jgi:hypothetical protein